MNEVSVNETGAILPPSTLGILGGGQLGRYFVMAARTMGYNVHVLDPDVEPLGRGAQRPRTRNAFAAPDRPDHDDVRPELQLRVPHDVPILRHRKQLDEAEGAAEPPNRRAGVVVPKEREDRLHRQRSGSISSSRLPNGSVT